MKLRKSMRKAQATRAAHSGRRCLQKAEVYIAQVYAHGESDGRSRRDMNFEMTPSLD